MAIEVGFEKLRAVFGLQKGGVEAAEVRLRLVERVDRQLGGADEGEQLVFFENLEVLLSERWLAFGSRGRRPR